MLMKTYFLVDGLKKLDRMHLKLVTKMLPILTIVVAIYIYYE